MTDDPIAKYYSDKYKEATRLRELIRERTREGAPESELKKLREKLELAEYTGD